MIIKCLVTNCNIAEKLSVADVFDIWASDSSNLEKKSKINAKTLSPESSQ